MINQNAVPFQAPRTEARGGAHPNCETPMSKVSAPNQVEAAALEASCAYIAASQLPTHA